MIADLNCREDDEYERIFVETAGGVLSPGPSWVGREGAIRHMDNGVETDWCYDLQGDGYKGLGDRVKVRQDGGVGGSGGGVLCW